MPDLVTLATPYTDRLLVWFAETTLIGSAFAVLALLVTRIRWIARGPAARHAFWLLVLIKLVTPPLIHWPWSLASPVVSTRPEPVELELPAVSSIEIEIAKPGPISSGSVEESIGDPEREIDTSGPQPWTGLTVWIASAWVVGSVCRGLFQGVRLARFGRVLTATEPAPAWLVEEAESVARRMGIRVPPIRVVDHLATPLVWCLGRPVLVVPIGLLKTLEADRWRAILTHELAHLRRGDHWVRRLEMVAGLAWWWCPLFWWVCRKLEFEAELASDAWAVWESPGDRVNYAESLIRIGTKLSLVEPPTPALGVAGSGRSFERRLTMILKNQVERHISMPSLFLAASLGALALPSWTLAGQASDEPSKASPIVPKFEVVVTDEPIVQVIFVDDEDDDDGDDDDKETPARKPSQKKKEKQEAALKEVEKKQRRMEIEVEAKFGPGSDFARKMEAMGKEIEVKFGDGSEIAKKMEALGKEMEAKFGPSSEVAKVGKKPAETKKKVKMKAETREKALKEKDEEAKSDEKKVSRKVEVKVAASDKAEAARAKQARRIDAIQVAIDKLQAELKALKAESKEDEDEDDDEDQN
jgi:beta-lactamase regulating signal transducer with metallopeptidase domain